LFFSILISTDQARRQVLRGTFPSNSVHWFSHPHFWSLAYCCNTCFETRRDRAKYSSQRGFVSSVRKGSHYSVDQVHCTKSEACNSVANPKLRDRNIQKAFVARIS
jgi:hypothetical protein